MAEPDEGVADGETDIGCVVYQVVDMGEMQDKRLAEKQAMYGEIDVNCALEDDVIPLG